MRKVEIQPAAFKKMIFHGLRFANENLEESQEVLGICIGTEVQDESKIIVVDTITLTHGDQIALGLSKELHELFEKIRNEYGSGQNKIVGWYLSHPGYALEFTNSDKSIQLYFQNESNPNAIAVIYDPLKFTQSNNFGVKCFKLEDYKHPEKYFELECVLRIPNTLDFFKWVKELMEESQKKKPQLIYEYEEPKKPKLEELQEIPQSEEPKKQIVEMDDKIEALLDGAKKGTTAFTDDFLDVYKSQLENWTNDVKIGSLKGTEYLRSSLNQLNKTINKGLEGLQGYFKAKFNEISAIFVKGITESLESRIEFQEEIKTHSVAITDEISNLEEKLIRDTFSQIHTDLNSSFKNLETEVINHEEHIKRINELIKNNLGKVSELHSSLNNFSEDMNEQLKKSCNPFEQKSLKLIEDQNMNFTIISEKYQEIEQLIDRLQKLISEIRQIK